MSISPKDEDTPTPIIPHLNQLQTDEELTNKVLSEWAIYLSSVHKQQPLAIPDPVICNFNGDPKAYLEMQEGLIENGLPPTFLLEKPRNITYLLQSILNDPNHEANQLNRNTPPYISILLASKTSKKGNPILYNPRRIPKPIYLLNPDSPNLPPLFLDNTRRGKFSIYPELLELIMLNNIKNPLKRLTEYHHLLRSQIKRDRPSANIIMEDQELFQRFHIIIHYTNPRNKQDDAYLAIPMMFNNALTHEDLAPSNTDPISKRELSKLKFIVSKSIFNT